MSKRLFNLIIKAFLWIYGILSLYPLVWMLFYSLKNNSEIFLTNPFGLPTSFRIDNYVRAWSTYNVFRYFSNSLFVTFATITITIIVSLFFAYATTRMLWRYKEPVRLIVITGMFIPVQVVMIPIAIIVRDFHLTNSYFSLILPYSAFQLGFSTLVFHSFLRTLPHELEEACCIDGASVFRGFISIIIPTLKPAIATMIIFIFLGSWNEFTLALVLITKETMKTMPLGLLFFQGAVSTDWGAMGAAMVTASVPAVLIYVIFNKQVQKAYTTSGAIKG